MAKSKKRGGEKAHRKRIQQRQVDAKKRAETMQKLFTEAMKTQLEEIKKQYEAESGKTDTDGVGFVQPETTL